jgi:hypothetical protein
MSAISFDPLNYGHFNKPEPRFSFNESFSIQPRTGNNIIEKPSVNSITIDPSTIPPPQYSPINNLINPLDGEKALLTPEKPVFVPEPDSRTYSMGFLKNELNTTNESKFNTSQLLKYAGAATVGGAGAIFLDHHTNAVVKIALGLAAIAGLGVTGAGLLLFHDPKKKQKQQELREKLLA